MKSFLQLAIAAFCIAVWSLRSFADDVIRLVSADEIVPASERPAIFREADQMLAQTADECNEICQVVSQRSTCENCETVDWHVLPEGLLWHSYLAGPQEPRNSLLIFNDSRDGIFADATLGGRFGMLRYGTINAKNPRGWQWDLEGAVITRLDIRNSEDIESVDYRFGTEITAADGPWAMKFGYFHISSHVGDEYIERNPTFVRDNYVTESLILGGSYRAFDQYRIYGEMANAFHVSGGARKYQIQSGLEYTPIAKVPARGAPFAAMNFSFREAVDYDVSTTIQMGWSFQGSESQRQFRVGAQYGSGPTSQFSFFERREEYIGGGLWYDF